MRARALFLAVAALLPACGVSLPFTATPTPAPTPVRAAATPTASPTPVPKPQVEVRTVRVALVDAERGPSPLSVSVAFQLRNPSTSEWLFQALATGSFTTPDGRPLPQTKPTAPIDLAPGEEKWFAYPLVDTLGSVVGKAEIAVTGGTWLPASTYPYPGGVPLAMSRAKEQKTVTPGAADYVGANGGDLGFVGGVRGFAFDASGTFIGLLECPARLYPAKSEVVVTCIALRAQALNAPRITFVPSPDLRPVLVTPSPTPSPTPGR